MAAFMSALSLGHPGLAAAQDRARERQASSAVEGRVRREPRGGQAAERTQPPPAASVSADTDDQRRGAVRRPPPGGGSQAGGSTPRTGDRAVPRTAVPNRPNRVYVNPYYYRPYRYYYDPWGYTPFGLGYFYYSPWGWYPNYAYGYGYPAYGYGYAAPGYGTYDRGAVKLKIKPRDAQVFVDGAYAGTVDEFDGALQSLKLNSGGYQIEVRKPGFETLHYDVRVQPDHTVTLKDEMKPVQ
jgi:hypothetical protein